MYQDSEMYVYARICFPSTYPALGHGGFGWKGRGWEAIPDSTWHKAGDHTELDPSLLRGTYYE